MERDPLVNREEVVGALFTLADMNANIDRIRELLEEEFGGEEGLEEDTA